MAHPRRYSPTDDLLIGLDQALRTVFGRPMTTTRPNPAEGLVEADLDEAERRHVGRLMRVNHSGEVCAQALYQGQAVTAHLPVVRETLERSAAEEADHLAWCESRLRELGARRSLLNPAWYAGSFTLGALTGLIGDRWSLGFVVETERQVESHLEGHLREIPERDIKTRTLIQQMKVDEIHHAQVAGHAGGVALPGPVRWVMKITAKVMTRTAYWI
ncbi:2-polyprenyl-3-methyl-6-methoxy-1,4-benzoquinone monooxygenase [Thiococcus pfennigii]|jgi:ubiquinone biosynthesis monooxygenase Coq7|uniref:2-polyprenyl-3-methyl-6-methoxy-1,4-benzoquinone monooxygenase n=1 Tax=Thiococcus pfennigii TaxID=1057 RepID=UPI001904FC85|nr:2-polyprenyl-3-methyl-6-methoxy-1,4-benzoquinone monooxygenase [Thiococcus pfennigii]MBK1700304.1 demethoxyubiquinone hydroxylase family protein [Thiococcus pfennigii]MBK1730560.1 demethoxyubiquinone hydroxylase family protein [Thiococcus pfennigii]